MIAFKRRRRQAVPRWACQDRPTAWNRLALCRYDQQNVLHRVDIRRIFVSIVTISSRFQVVIPKDVREQLDLKPGQRVQAIAFRGRIELIPEKAMKEARGFLKGIDSSVPREDDRV